jgi:hypothetical protein
MERQAPEWLKQQQQPYWAEEAFGRFGTGNNFYLSCC